MGQWVGAQGRPKMTKISKTCPHCDVTSRKPPQKTKNENEKRFLSMSTRRLADSVEGLNSSLALAAGDLWPKKGRPTAAVKRLIKETLAKTSVVRYLSIILDCVPDICHVEQCAICRRTIKHTRNWREYSQECHAERACLRICSTVRGSWFVSDGNTCLCMKLRKWLHPLTICVAKAMTMGVIWEVK